MRLIFQGFGRAWAVELNAHKVLINPSDENDEPEDDETLRPDPRGTVYAHIERRSDLEDAYAIAPKPGFGFTQRTYPPCILGGDHGTHGCGN